MAGRDPGHDRPGGYARYACFAADDLLEVPVGPSIEAARQALAPVLDGAIRLAPLITDRLPFTRYAEGIERLRAKTAIKILFEPWG